MELTGTTVSNTEQSQLHLTQQPYSSHCQYLNKKSPVQKVCKRKSYFRQFSFQCACRHKILRFSFQTFSKIPYSHQIKSFPSSIKNHTHTHKKKIATVFLSRIILVWKYFLCATVWLYITMQFQLRNWKLILKTLYWWQINYRQVTEEQPEITVDRESR